MLLGDRIYLLENLRIVTAQAKSFHSLKCLNTKVGTPRRVE